MVSSDNQGETGWLPPCEGMEDKVWNPGGGWGHLLGLLTIVIHNRKTGRTAEELDPLEMKIEVIRPAPVYILAEGKGRKHGVNSGGRKL